MPPADSESWPNSANLAYVEDLYEQYLRDPTAVDPHWRRQFDRWSHDESARPVQLRPSFTPASIFNPTGDRYPARAGNGSTHAAAGNGSATRRGRRRQPQEITVLQHKVDQLIRNYRVRGHIIARLDPLGTRNEEPPELSPAYYGLTQADMDRPFACSTIPGASRRTLRRIIQQLRNTYCRYIGVQFMHIDNLAVREWLQERMETTRNKIELSRKEQIRILTRLTDAVIFEEFIQKKFIGAKSFSLEGGESLIPLMDLSLEKAGDQGVKEIVIGMAHRGRLNVLANIMGKSPQKIFREFEDIDPQLYMGGGDVKYHLGHSSDWRTRSGHNIHLSLAFNPSHLEYVNPVALGRMRAKQDRTGLESRGEKGLVLLIHGDAAFAGEGIVQETLNLSQLQGYTTGGTVHIIVNNQIGFTTAPHDARSSRYASDVGRMLQIPIFHVNGEHPEAVAQVVNLAMDFRMRFKRDVIIDMYCYRRRGHNEGDEPSYTQPQMYQLIERRESVREAYLGHLLKLGGLTRDDADRIAKRRTELLEKELTAARSDSYVPKALKPVGLWANYIGGREDPAHEAATGVEAERLRELLLLQSSTPAGFHPHPKINRLLKLREEMAHGRRPLDWAGAEALAFASLAVDGHRVRLSGQDVQRGTFSHRHAVLHDAHDGRAYMPLQHLSPGQAPVEVYNSPLSESGVLGFDYGYSLDYPEALVAWEAQFGDFVNVAQPIIDQFISSAEDKWNRLSGLVMLLPHGFEGQGPEHSSARLERFLQIAAEDNIQVCQPSTPAQYFHLLRRQVLRRWRKPLVVLTPKSLLRHPRCVSPLELLSSGRFERVLADVSDTPSDRINRVLLCSGKVYFELVERREKLDRQDVAILRLEQYYPFPDEALRGALEGYRDGTPVVWVQDEPRNMGAWSFLYARFCDRMHGRLPLTGVMRKASASPATGSRAAHQIEQEQILNQAFGETP
jgi:2-oxoglutarate dehydrogenase E1 component